MCAARPETSPYVIQRTPIFQNLCFLYRSPKDDMNTGVEYWTCRGTFTVLKDATEGQHAVTYRLTALKLCRSSTACFVDWSAIYSLYNVSHTYPLQLHNPETTFDLNIYMVRHGVISIRPNRQGSGHKKTHNTKPRRKQLWIFIATAQFFKGAAKKVPMVGNYGLK